MDKEEVAVPEIKTKKSFELLEKIKEENQVKNGENLIRKIARV